VNRRAAWWLLWPVWVVPALLLVVNLAWLGWLRGAIVGRGSLLAREVAELREAVGTLEAQQRQLAAAEQELATLTERLEGMRGRQLGPMRERLVPFLTDVVERAEQAGLKPERIGYAVREEEKTGLAQFTATYQLKGPYESVRRCVWLLETSPQFVVIESISLRAPEDASSLDVDTQFTLATYFSDIDRAELAKLEAGEVPRGGQD
jgi:Tfp pilus assembly protein PilO